MQHFAISCPSRLASEKASKNDTVCAYCKKPGHTLDNCFKRQREENVSNSNSSRNSVNNRTGSNYSKFENSSRVAAATNSNSNKNVGSAVTRNNSISENVESQQQQFIYKDSPTIGTTPYCIIKARGYELQVLIDSGASLSLLSKWMVDKLKIHKQDIVRYSKDHHVVQFGNGGDTGSLYGLCQFTFKVSGDVFTHAFRIIEGLADRIIFGSDFFLKKR